MALFSFNDSEFTGLPFRGFTLHWYRAVLDDRQVLRSIGNSIYVAIGAVGLSVAFGLPAAVALDRYQFPGKIVFRRIVLLPIVLPGVITGVSLLLFYVLVGLKLSLYTVILGQGTALMCVTITEVFARLQQVGRSREEAALDLGANPWEVFRQVTLPSIRSALAGAVLIAFSISFDEIAVTYLLTGPAKHAAHDALVDAAPERDTGSKCHLNSNRRRLDPVDHGGNGHVAGRPNTKGEILMDLKQIKEIIEANDLRTIILIGTDSCNVQRGKRVPIPYFFKIAESGVNFASYILYTTMMDEVLPGLFDTGIPDVRGAPDLSTFRYGAVGAEHRSGHHGLDTAGRLAASALSAQRTEAPGCARACAWTRGADEHRIRVLFAPVFGARYSSR